MEIGVRGLSLQRARVCPISGIALFEVRPRSSHVAWSIWTPLPTLLRHRDEGSRRLLGASVKTGVIASG